LDVIAVVVFYDGSPAGSGAALLVTRIIVIKKLVGFAYNVRVFAARQTVRRASCRWRNAARRHALATVIAGAPSHLYAHA
jgi:hypothetical protein